MEKPVYNLFNSSDVGYWDDYNDYTPETKKEKKVIEDCNECEMIKIDNIWTCETCGRQDA